MHGHDFDAVDGEPVIQRIGDHGFEETHDRLVAREDFFDLADLLEHHLDEGVAQHDHRRLFAEQDLGRAVMLAGGEDDDVPDVLGVFVGNLVPVVDRLIVAARGLVEGVLPQSGAVVVYRRDADIRLDHAPRRGGMPLGPERHQEILDLEVIVDQGEKLAEFLLA